MKSLIKKYTISLIISLLIFGSILWTKDIFHQTVKSDIFKILCDASFVTSALFIGYGLLVLASNGGTFDMMVYGLRTFFNLFSRDRSRIVKQSFYDYRVEKQSKNGSFWYLVIVGVFYLIIAIIMLQMYHNCI